MLNCWEFAYPNTLLLTGKIMCHQMRSRMSINETSKRMWEEMPLDSSETFNSTLTEACKTTNPASNWFWTGNLFDVSHIHERSKLTKYAHVSLRRTVCMCVCVCVCVCARARVCIYIYIYIFGRSAAATSIQFHGKKTQNNINCYVSLLIKDRLSGLFPRIGQQNKNSQSSVINISCNSTVHWPLMLHPTAWHKFQTVSTIAHLR